MSRGGRQPFGFRKNNGKIIEVPEMIAVARRIIELRDAGMKFKDIRDTEGISWPDGWKLSVDTIRRIAENKDLYER